MSNNDDNKPRMIKDIKADINEARRAVKIHLACVGDLMGCDYSRDVYDSLRWELTRYEEELEDARAWRAKRRAT